jgi:hypothetical protein
MAETGRCDLIFIFSLLLIILIPIVLIFAIKRALSRSFICLDLASANGIAQISTLPDPSRNFSVALPKRPATMKCVSCGLFEVVRFTSKPWKLIRTHDGQKTELSTYIILPFWKLRTIWTVLACHDCKLTLLIVHSHEYIYSDAMKQNRNTDNPQITETRVSK